MRECQCVTPSGRFLSAVVLVVLAVLGSGFATKVGAHFLLNLNVRVFHIDHVQDGLILHMRTPMPYLVADKLGQTEVDGLPDPAPFTTNAVENGQLVHFVDLAQIAADPFGIGRIAEGSLTLESGGGRLDGTVEAVVVHAVGREPPFATLHEARKSMAAPFAPLNLPKSLYVGDAVVDVTIRYGSAGPIETFSLSSQLDPGLPAQELTANLILDYGPGEPQVYRSRGLLNEPVEISRSRLAAVGTFVWEGVRHILEGLDHVLFVVCLVLSATSLRGLLWRVTGFTIGHSLTLALGFFGYVPRGDWFVPAVETGIALSIAYAGFLALRTKTDSERPEQSIFLVTLGIGLLHGLGFSFVLQELLQVTSPNIWQSLLAFNVGVELGQLLIVLAIWPLLVLLNRYAEPLGRLSRQLMALGCTGIALFWTFERTFQLAESMG